MSYKTTKQRRRERRRASWREFGKDAVVVSVIGLIFAAASTGILALLLGVFHILAMVGA